MSELYKRLRLVLATALVCTGLCAGVARADLSLVCNPTRATANSVWNLEATWTDDSGRWPLLMPFGISEGSVEGEPIDWNPTIGQIRPFLAEGDEPGDEVIFWPQLHGLRGFVGFADDDPLNPGQPYELFQPEGWESVQPDPAPTVMGETDGDARFDHGMDFVSAEFSEADGEEGVAIVSEETPPLKQVTIGADSTPEQMFLPARDAYTLDPDPEVEGDEVEHPETPMLLVPTQNPLWLVGAWLDRSRTLPVKARIVNAADLNPNWPQINVISFPDGIPRGYPRVYVSYYCPGTHYVATKRFPLSMPYSVYVFHPDPRTNAPNITRLRINDRILNLNPNKTDPNSADPLDPTLPGPLSGLLGVYDTPEMDGVNYFTPGDYEPPGGLHPDYGIINLSNIPEGGLPRETTLYVKVDTFAVDAVYDNFEREGVNYFVGLENQLGKYDSKQGILRLAQQLPPPDPVNISPDPEAPPVMAIVAGRQVFVDYRPLSRTDVTVAKPVLRAVTGVGLLPPNDDWSFDAPTVTYPGDGRFRFNVEGQLPLGTYAVGVNYRFSDPDAPPQGVVWLRGAGGGFIPMYYVEGDPISGATYRVSVSAGLNMSNTLQQPSTEWLDNNPFINNRLIYDPRSHPMWYAPALVAEGDGSPATRVVAATGWFVNDSGEVETYDVGDVSLTVHDSRPRRFVPGGLQREMIDYAGQADDRDWLTCYPDGEWPYNYDVDPLSIEPIEDANPTAPDSGSSTTEFVFRVRYNHLDGTNTMPPLPWLPGAADPWVSGGPSGVVLYLDAAGTGDYRPHFMHLENPYAAPGDYDYDVYIYRVNPKHKLLVSGDPPGYPWQSGRSDLLGLNFDNMTYQSLAAGQYHYFFACSDDSLTFDNGSFPFENQSLLGVLEYGQNPQWNTRYSTGLDPSLARSVAGYAEINRTAKRRYSADGIKDFDYTIHVDRPVRVPGFFEEVPGGYKYNWDAENHPVVTCELRMPVADDKYVRYDDWIYGSGRFFGTVENFYRASNPAHIGSYTNGPNAALAETHGAKSNADNVFRILYRSLYNQPPIYIRVYINNASEKSGTTPQHAYTAYSMYPRADQTQPYNYRNGVWYEFKTKLPPGPHTYYFQAYDGNHVARFPVRPDLYEYASVDFAAERAITASGSFTDFWIPTQSKNTERQNPDYYDNDYFPGPYVNNPCVLSEASVTPGSGKEGQAFRYRVKYADPDGQRVFSAFINIEINDKGDVRRFAMRPETPIITPRPGDPDADAKWAAIKEQYRTGVYYVLDTATLADFALQNGVRRYYFEFTDDWGRLNDVNDTVQGETTRHPAGADNWISGPIISGNTPPTLSGGSVTSQDGTANAATLWTFRVTYRDINNDPPALIKVYIGLLQPDGKTILWDDGHNLQPTSGGALYSDGVEYFYQTRLGAVDTVIAGEPQPAPKQYYYAFVGYDGVAWATYRSSSNDELRSNSANCLILDTALRLDARNYVFRPLIAQQGDVSSNQSVVTPANPGDIVRVYGVFDNEDLTGANYYDVGSPPLYAGGALTLTTPLPAGRTKAWIKYEAQSPIVGPLPVDLPAPAGVIPDAQVFENYTANPVPLFIDGQKNGWISSTDPTDRGTMVMEGLAVFEGQPSNRYVVPSDYRSIASVEGVYRYADFSGTNYYDPEVLDTPITVTGTVDPSDPNRTTVIPDRPDLITAIRGVYDNADLTGRNYYAGSNELRWQEAYIMADTTVWPLKPLDIVSVEGVHLNMDQSLLNYCVPDRLSIQEGEAEEFAVGLTVPSAVISVTGIYLSATAGGEPIGPNYYDPASASPPYVARSQFVYPTTPLPPGVSTVRVFYLDSDGLTQNQAGQVLASAVSGVDMQAIQDVLGVFAAVDAQNRPTGPNYYDPVLANPPYQMGDEVVRLTTPMPIGEIYIYYRNRGFGYGPEGEYLALTQQMPPTAPKAYVAYRPAGTLTEDGKIMLSTPIPVGVSQVFVHIEAETYKCGDRVIRLTTDLPDPLHPAEPNNRTVYIKYCDIRFTHRLRGEATQPVASGEMIFWYNGTTHYTPDGWLAGNVRIKGNRDDVTAGLVGVWLDEHRESANYFDPRKANRYDDNLLHWRLTTEAPAGSNYLWARYYQQGDYHLDRWNRNLVFLSDRSASSVIQGSYFFGTRMPATLGPNTPCELYNGSVTPLTGSRSTQYVYRVTYRDLDGPNGQAPEYVRVYIDGQAFDMTPESLGGTPAYNEGAVFTYTPPSGLAGGSHKYHFEATDGVSVAWFDANGSHQSLARVPVEDVVDLDGPWVNNPPELAQGAASPNPTNATISTNQSVDYTVVYTDLDNNPPYFFDPLTDLDSGGQPIGDSVRVSGSPRVWIDSGVTDVSYTGTVAALAPDPLETGKIRRIIAAGSPGWSADQFAGRLMQITDGSLDRRVYLIQSNTENTLTIATDDLARDGLAVGVGFRIGGLLMSKVDPTQQDFTGGVLYRVTVPKLSAGTHKFHFTARSRELKPQWLREMMTAAGQVALPYSSEVRHPVSGDFDGPTVERTVPPGNSAPSLDNTADTSLYRGPMAQAAAVDSAGIVAPETPLQIRSVLGVYVNATLTGANYHDPATAPFPFRPGDTTIRLSTPLAAIAPDAVLVRFGTPAALGAIGVDLNTVLPTAPSTIGSVLGVFLEADTQMTGVNYYDPAIANPPFAPGNTQIRLTRTLPSGTKRVLIKCTPAAATQTGGVSAPDTVVPSSAAAVAGVVGVYLVTDTAMTGTNYYDPATASPAFAPGDPSIKLTTPLPGGTTQVRIKYVPWPPVHVAYFAFPLTDPSVPPSATDPNVNKVYLAGEPLTFRIIYKDPDNDPPTYHDGVQGYVRVVFNDTGRSALLTPLNPPVIDYTSFVPFTVTLTDVPMGSRRYHYEASDGYYDVFHPTGLPGNPRANDYFIRVNHKPALLSGTVNPTSGATLFNFSATYRDEDNAPPSIVTVRLAKVGDPSLVITRQMTLDPAETSPNYSLGARYVAQIDATDTAQPLTPGRYNVVFEANDGFQDADPLAGPDIVVRDSNIAPVIVNYSVSPASGKTGITFTYSAYYYDAEGDSPVTLYAGQRVEGLTLVVDKGFATEQRLLMTRPTDSGGPPAPPGGVPAPPNYSQDGGVLFTASISGRRLGPGRHNYTVEASDGTDPSVFAPGVPSLKSGPVMMVPYFGLNATTKDGVVITDRVVVGEEALISGHMYFPYTGNEDQRPRAIDDITLQVTKPEGTVISLNASLSNIRTDNATPPQFWVGDITANYGGYVDPALSTGNSLTLTASGQWRIGAIWPGDTQWDSAETDTNMDGQNDIVVVSVSGPSRTVAVVDPERPDTSEPVIDMITPPMIIGSPDPGAIFGADRALEMQIVRWSPSSNTYFRYGVGGLFPPLQPGDAIWIKPRQYDPVTQTGYPAAEFLGVRAVLRTFVDAADRVFIPVNAAGRQDYVAYVAGAYVNSGLTGVNYYDPADPKAIANPFRQGHTSFVLTRSLPAGTEVWVDYVIFPLRAVDDGWISFDNPTVARAIDGGEPRYYHTKYRLIKSLSQAYPLKTDSMGSVILDPETGLPQLKSSQVALRTGWNQFGNIFFNWRKTTQQALPVQKADGSFDLTRVRPSDPSAIQGRLLGVYLTPQMTGENYYKPGIAAAPYTSGSDEVVLTTSLPGPVSGDSRFYLKYEQYPREDVGIPIDEVYVNYLGQRRTLAEAAAAGWIHDYAWRYDAATRRYVQVHATAAGAERVLKAWSGYWIRALINCTLEIDPNTNYNGN